MRQYIDSAKVKRNARIARILSFGGLASMGLGLVISFQNPNDTRPVLGLFLVGILTSQIGQPMRNRWDRRPRIDELLDRGRGSLDDGGGSGPDALGGGRILIGPGGGLALIPGGEAGKIEDNNGNWTRTTSRGALIRRAGTRSIRGIEREADAEVDRANSRLDLTFSVRPMFVFMHSNAEMNVHQAPAIASHLKKLKSSIRRLPKAETLSQKQIALLAEDHGFA